MQFEAWLDEETRVSEITWWCNGCCSWFGFWWLASLCWMRLNRLHTGCQRLTCSIRH